MAYATPSGMAAKRVLVTGAPSGLGAALADLALRAWDALGGVDVLINNAAMPKRRSVIALKPDEAEEVMRVNFFAPMRLTLALLPRMLARGSGTIVNVSSVGGRLGIIHESVYCASKVALCGWSEAMAVDLHDTPISVKLPEPGPVDTEIWDHPEKVVDAKNADLDAFITGAAGMAPR